MDVQLLVAPKAEVSEGTLLSLTLVLANRTPDVQRGVTVAVPVPYGASYVPGTLFHDAVRVGGEAFFQDGCELAILEPAARSAFLWKLRVEGAEGPIRIVPQVFAGVTPIFGAEPVEVTRSAAPRDLAGAYREFEAAARAYFEEIFGRPAPVSLQQALFACALACALDAERKDATLDLQAQALHRLARAVRAHHVTGVDPNFLLELRGLREARLAAATIEGLRAFAALDVAARNLAANDRVRDTISFT